MFLLGRDGSSSTLIRMKCTPSSLDTTVIRGVYGSMAKHPRPKKPKKGPFTQEQADTLIMIVLTGLEIANEQYLKDA